MLHRQERREHVRAGWQFAIGLIVVGPLALTLMFWATRHFKVEPQYLLLCYVENAVHFGFYSLLFGRFLVWDRLHRRPFGLAVRGLIYAGLAITATSLAVTVNGVTGIRPAEFPRTYMHAGLVALIVSPFALLLEHGWHRLGEANREAQRRALEEETVRRAAAEARWTSLESRLHPHFVFNTLASIRELMHRDLPQADVMIQRFSELLRFSLDAPQRSFLSLREEIRMVATYLEIEKMRLGDRLTWSIDSTGAPVDARIPSLTLLTLVENAVKHAISTRRAGGRVDIVARADEGKLRLSVSDDGPGFPHDELPSGRGLDLLRDRLTLLYGEAADLRFSTPPNATTIEIVVPLSRFPQEDEALAPAYGASGR